MCGLGSVQLYSILTKNLFMIKLWPAIFAGAPPKKIEGGRNWFELKYQIYVVREKYWANIFNSLK